MKNLKLSVLTCLLSLMLPFSSQLKAADAAHPQLSPAQMKAVSDYMKMRKKQDPVACFRVGFELYGTCEKDFRAAQSNQSSDATNDIVSPCKDFANDWIKRCTQLVAGQLRID